jgi:hypothetical protein
MTDVTGFIVFSTNLVRNSVSYTARKRRSLQQSSLSLSDHAVRLFHIPERKQQFDWKRTAHSFKEGEVIRGVCMRDISSVCAHACAHAPRRISLKGRVIYDSYLPTFHLVVRSYWQTFSVALHSWTLKVRWDGSSRYCGGIRDGRPKNLGLISGRSKISCSPQC